MQIHNRLLLFLFVHNVDPILYNVYSILSIRDQMHIVYTPMIIFKFQSDFISVRYYIREDHKKRISVPRVRPH